VLRRSLFASTLQLTAPHCRATQLSVHCPHQMTMMLSWVCIGCCPVCVRAGTILVTILVTVVFTLPQQHYRESNFSSGIVVGKRAGHVATQFIRGTCAISGVVTTAASGRPLPMPLAMVTMSGNTPCAQRKRASTGDCKRQGVRQDAEHIAKATRNWVL